MTVDNSLRFDYDEYTLDFLSRPRFGVVSQLYRTRNYGLAHANTAGHMNGRDVALSGTAE